MQQQHAWTSHVDGFVSGDVGIFPGFFGSWEVWERVSGEWQQVEPLVCAEKAGSREETIEEAKRLATEWRSARASA